MAYAAVPAPQQLQVRLGLVGTTKLQTAGYPLIFPRGNGAGSSRASNPPTQATSPLPVLPHRESQACSKPASKQSHGHCSTSSA